MAERFDVEALLGIPRVSGMAVSPDGSRLVVGAATPAPDGKRFATALWEVDPSGRRAARRLTRSAKGEEGAAFLPDGSLLFLSSRPDPVAPGEAREGAEEVSRLWLMAPGGGEAVAVEVPAGGGIAALRVARESGVIVAAVPVMRGATSWEEDRRLAEERRTAGVEARLFEDLPVRHWDHYLGPRTRRLAIGRVSGPPEHPRLDLTDLTGDAGTALEECDFDITPDGSTVVTGWRYGRDWQQRLVALDAAGGAARVLIEDAALDAGSPSCSPDGTRVAALVTRLGRPDSPMRTTVHVAGLGDGSRLELLAGSELYPEAVSWTADSAALLVSAEERGTRPLWLVAADGGEPRRLAGGATFEDAVAMPDGRVAAVRSHLDAPPHPAVVDGGGSVTVPPGPAPAPSLHTRIEEIWTASPDGRGRVHSFLHLPPGASAADPVPLLVLIHGGPIASFRGWSWRWCAHVFADHSYAVLAVNPALSTGYGWENLDRSWGTWGAVVAADVLAATEEAASRPEVDGTRVGAAGGSFGGYMANWLAGHTDRFACLVTHASVYDLDQWYGTCDVGWWIEEEFGSPYEEVERYRANSPNTALQAIASRRTPMLIIHGELDARVPVGDGLRLFTNLRRLGVPARLLHFPDENHWILRPQNSRLWYRTVLAFLDEHLRGFPFSRPELL